MCVCVHILIDFHKTLMVLLVVEYDDAWNSWQQDDDTMATPVATSTEPKVCSVLLWYTRVVCLSLLF